MKNLLITALILLTTSIYAQDKGDEILNLVADKVCECTEENQNENPDIISRCISEGLKSESDNMKAYVEERKEKEGDAFDAQKYREQTFYVIQKKLIWNCDAYFNFVEEMRSFGLEEYAKKLPDTYLDSISQVLKEEKTVKNYSDRAGFYFVIEDYNATLSDCKSCLKIDPEYFACLFMMAWVYEKQGKFDKAIETYEQMKSTTTDQGNQAMIEIYSEAALRKKDKSFK